MVSKWLCEECYNRLEQEHEVIPLPNWIDQPCILCDNIAKYLTAMDGSEILILKKCIKRIELK